MDKGTTRVVSGIMAVPTMTGMPVALTTATRVRAAPLVLLHSTLTTREVPPAPPRPPTTKIDPLITGCPKGLRGRTALDIGNPVLNQTHQLTLALPSPYPTPPTPTN